MYRLRYSMFVVAAMAALFVSAFAVLPAYADEGNPPLASEETAPPADSSGEQEAAPPSEESVPPADSSGEQEAAPPSEESVPPADSSGEQEAALPSIEETPIMVVNEAGEVLPLASQEAAEVIANNDPMWCPVGVLPGGAGCTAATNSFATMLTNLTGLYGAAGPAKAGVIWIAAGYDSSVDDPGALSFTLDGSVLTTMNDYSLTINGGWSGTGTTLISTDPSEFNVPFSIINWNAPITINNLFISGAMGTGHALEVQTTGNISLNNTDVVGNMSQLGGALLDNYAGTGNVTVTNGSFSNNSGADAYGLEIYSKGAVTLKDIDASANAKRGAFIDNRYSATPKAVTLNGSNTFNHNSQDGLYILSRGAITLSNISAIGNLETGVYLDNCEFNFVTGACSLTGTAGSGVTLKGANLFISNNYEGLRIWSGGAISVSNIAAYANGNHPLRNGSTLVNPDGIPANGDEYYTYDAQGKGVFLHNYGAASPKSVIVSGTNSFNNNGSDGLFIYTKGFVAVNNVTANFNGCNPAKDIADVYCAGMYVYSESGVKQTGYGVFFDNFREGLKIDNYVKGYVALNNLDAQNNGSGGGNEGVEINAYNPSLAIPVAVMGVNVFKNNAFGGLHVEASGAVTLSNVTANYNSGGSGIFVYNVSPFRGPVTLLGQTIANQNGVNGIYILSYGAVTTSGVYARSNSSGGAFIDNCGEAAGACLAPSALPVSMYGDNVFLFNTGANLMVNSRGAIVVNNLTAHYSGNSFGAYLNNRYSNASAGVALRGYARAEFNRNENIAIYSNGAVSAVNVTANNSTTGYGMYVMNQAAAMPGVTISGVNQFNDNALTGLYITTYGTVAGSNFTASNNGNPSSAYGALIYNAGGPAPRPVTLTGVNVFNSNFNSGLYVDSYGAITVYNVTAKYNSNTGSGAILNNQYGLYIQPIILGGYGVFESNFNAGLIVESNGNVTTANLTAKNNSSDGVYIETSNNGSSSVAANVNLTGSNFFVGNSAGSGLYVLSDGHITANNLNANSNGAYGARLDNVSLAGAGEVKNVVVNGMNNFYFNIGTGLGVFSSGSAALTRIHSGANYNPGAPASDGVYANVAGALTLTCGKFDTNEGSGFNLNAAVIKLLGFLFSNNGAPNFAAAGTITQTKVCPLP